MRQYTYLTCFQYVCEKYIRPSRLRPSGLQKIFVIFLEVQNLLIHIIFPRIYKTTNQS